MERADRVLHIDTDVERSVYFISIQARTVAKFPRGEGGPLVVYTGYPESCTCPSFDHRKTCKHLDMWLKYTGDCAPAERAGAMAAFAVLGERTKGAVRFHSLDLTPAGQVKAVLASCDYPELTNIALTGEISGVLIRVFGPGLSPEAYQLGDGL